LIIDDLARWTAKYPFSKEAIEFLRSISLSLDEFIQGEYKYILDYAYERVLSDLKGIVRKDWENDYVESVSYYLATLIVAGTKNVYVYRRFSEAEAKRIYSLLKEENSSIIVKLGRELDIDIKHEGNVFKVDFIDFIKISRSLSSIHWRLYNYRVRDGYLILDKRRVSRLLTQTIKERIFSMIMKIGDIPPEINSLSQKVLEKIPKRLRLPDEELLKNVRVDEYPPCIRLLLENVSSGLSHPGRFTLVTFLNAIGFTLDQIIDVFRVTPDFNERMTRYQVEHILGMRGSRIKYSVPSCKKIRSYGYCIPDDICKKYAITHPLTYVKIKRRRREYESKR